MDEYFSSNVPYVLYSGYEFMPSSINPWGLES
jgi:hypothetical protein